MTQVHENLGNVGIVTYTGTAAVQRIPGLNFQSDLIWVKSTSAVYKH